MQLLLLFIILLKLGYASLEDYNEFTIPNYPIVFRWIYVRYNCSLDIMDSQGNKAHFYSDRDYYSCNYIGTYYWKFTCLSKSESQKYFSIKDDETYYASSELKTDVPASNIFYFNIPPCERNLDHKCLYVKFIRNTYQSDEEDWPKLYYLGEGNKCNI